MPIFIVCQLAGDIFFAFSKSGCAFGFSQWEQVKGLLISSKNFLKTPPVLPLPVQTSEGYFFKAPGKRADFCPYIVKSKNIFRYWVCIWPLPVETSEGIFNKNKKSFEKQGGQNPGFEVISERFFISLQMAYPCQNK